MATEVSLRQEIVWFGAQLHERGYIAGTDGNLSCRLDQNHILITPSGRPKGDLNTGDPVVIDMQGQKTAGALAPSSEFKMHLAIYRTCPRVNGIAHAHPPLTTALTVAGQKFPIDILPEGIITLSNMIWLDYATPSSEDLPRLMEKHLPKADIFVFKQHGVTSAGATLEEAYLKLETCEHQARVYFYARLLGDPQRLGAEEIARLKAIFGCDNPTGTK